MDKKYINVAPSGIMPQWKEETALDKQEGGSHYTSLMIQPIEYIQENNLGYIEGNIIKYITRHKRKNGAEDIKKIIHYCELLLELEYGEESKEEEPRESNEPEHRESHKTANPWHY